MKAKTFMLIAVFMAMLLVLSSSLASAQVNVAVLDVSLVSQNPYPAEPGKNLNIEIEIENTGTATATNKIVEMIPKDPFTILPGQNLKKIINNLGPQSSVKQTYDLNVDTGAITSDYKIDFKIYSPQTPETSTTRSITISVQGTPKLVLESVEIVPENPEPGGIVTLKLHVKNAGSGTARQVEASFGTGSEYLVPILSGTLVYVGDIAPGETKEAETQMSIDTLAEYKTYTTTLDLNYKDESNVDRSESFSIGIPVTGTITLDVINVEAEYSRGKLEIEVANKGTTDAKSLEAKFVMGEETIGVDYLSLLKATKKTTFSFPLVTEGQGKLIIDYVGPGLEKNQISKDITLDFQTNGGNETLINTIIVVVIIVIILYFVWRKFFRKKQNHRHHKQSQHTHVSGK